MRNNHAAVAVQDLAQFGEELSHVELVKVSGGRKTTTTTTPGRLTAAGPAVADIGDRRPADGHVPGRRRPRRSGPP